MKRSEKYLLTGQLLFTFTKLNFGASNMEQLCLVYMPVVAEWLYIKGCILAFYYTYRRSSDQVHDSLATVFPHTAEHFQHDNTPFYKACIATWWFQEHGEDSWLWWSVQSPYFPLHQWRPEMVWFAIRLGNLSENAHCIHLCMVYHYCTMLQNSFIPFGRQ